MSRKATRKDVLFALEYGHEKLVKTIVYNAKPPDQYTLSGSGIEVPAGIARDILSDPHMIPADAGLFPGMAQSFIWQELAA